MNKAMNLRSGGAIGFLVGAGLALGSGAGFVLAADPPSAAQTTAFEAPIAGGGPPAVWAGCGLLSVTGANSDAPLFRTYDATGRLVREFRLSIAGAARVNVYSGGFSCGRDGTVAVCGSAYSADSRGAGFIALAPADARPQTVIRMTSYAPRRVVVAGDGSIWVAGRELHDGRENDPHHAVLRRYGPAGQLLGQWLPKSSLTLVPGVGHPVMFSHLVASQHRVGWYSPAANQYVEYTPDGSESRRVPLPQADHENHPNVALCDDGTVYAQVVSRNAGTPRSSALYKLDVGSVVWSRVDNVPPIGHLYGCKDNSLALGPVGASGLRIEWLTP